MCFLMTAGQAVDEFRREQMTNRLHVLSSEGRSCRSRGALWLVLTEREELIRRRLKKEAVNAMSCRTQPAADEGRARCHQNVRRLDW